MDNDSLRDQYYLRVSASMLAALLSGAESSAQARGSAVLPLVNIGIA